MTICKQCGVELDEGLDVCPLCDTSVTRGTKVQTEVRTNVSMPQASNSSRPVLTRILWQIVCVLLLSGIIATLLINLAILGQVTWSIYPITICLMVLSYASLMALWHTHASFQVLGGWAISV